MKIREIHSYQSIFDSSLKNLIKPQNVVGQIIKNKLEMLDVPVNPKQYSKLLDQIKGFEKEKNLSFQLSDKQIKASGLTKEELESKINSSLADLIPDLEKYTDKLETLMPEVVQNLSKVCSRSLYKSVKRSRKSVIADRQVDQFLFESRLFDTWGKAFDVLETLIGIAIESGELFVRNLNHDKTGIFEEVLIIVHARCCQIAGEILALLKTGFADGAFARWRSLHEVSTIALFIADNDYLVAERYFYHQDIETLRHMQAELSRFPAFEEDQEFQNVLSELKDAEQDLLGKYGQEFATDFGWAASTLNKKKPTFRDIEAAINLDFLRIHYKHASLNVHGSSKGAFDRLGTVYGIDSPLLAGRSNVGLEIPGYLCAVSLTQVTIALLTKNSNLDQIVYMKVIGRLEREADTNFKKLAKKLRKQIEKINLKQIKTKVD